MQLENCSAFFPYLIKEPVMTNQDLFDECLANIESLKDADSERSLKNLNYWRCKMQELLWRMGEPDEMSRELSTLFPNAKSRRVVRHNGHRYRKRFFPVREMEWYGRWIIESWGHYWEDMGPFTPRASSKKSSA